MTRLRAVFWVAAFLRRCNSAGQSAVLRRRGAAEAGAIFIKIDRLDGMAALYGPAPQSEVTEAGVERVWALVHREPWIESADAEARLRKEISFDPDSWIVEVEDREGRALFDTVP